MSKRMSREREAAGARGGVLYVMNDGRVHEMSSTSIHRTSPRELALCVRFAQEFSLAEWCSLFVKASP